MNSDRHMLKFRAPRAAHFAPNFKAATDGRRRGLLAGPIIPPTAEGRGRGGTPFLIEAQYFFLPKRNGRKERAGFRAIRASDGG